MLWPLTKTFEYRYEIRVLPHDVWYVASPAVLQPLIGMFTSGTNQNSTKWCEILSAGPYSVSTREKNISNGVWNTPKWQQVLNKIWALFPLQKQPYIDTVTHITEPVKQANEEIIQKCNSLNSQSNSGGSHLRDLEHSIYYAVVYKISGKVTAHAKSLQPIQGDPPKSSQCQKSTTRNNVTK